MAEMTIRLRCDPATGKRDIIIKLESDADALPFEHEQQHRALVEKLIQGGLVKASELGRVVIERQDETRQGEIQDKQQAQPTTEPAQRRAVEQGPS